MIHILGCVAVSFVECVCERDLILLCVFVGDVYDKIYLEIVFVQSLCVMISLIYFIIIGFLVICHI